MLLSTPNLIQVFEDCLAKPEQVREAILVEGIYLTYGYNRERLEANRAVIESLLRQLPDELQADTRPGGGYSFLNSLRTSWGDPWTVNFHHADILLTLGMAIGRAEILTPRITWHLLPASLPIIRVTA